MKTDRCLLRRASFIFAFFLPWLTIELWQWRPIIEKVTATNPLIWCFLEEAGLGFSSM